MLDQYIIIIIIIISPNVIATISNINSELDISSDHYTMTVTLTSEKLRSKGRNISQKLYHTADWLKINENIQNKLNKLFGIFDIIKGRPINEIK